jgi:hypothetical protein
MLQETGELWEVYTLAMLGWNTENELAALRTYRSTIQPDVVVICPTSNDIDDPLMILNGRLVAHGFESGAIFRYSFEYQRRWINVFRQLDGAASELERDGIPTLIYFLAEWRTLAPYYAELAGTRARYTVVPTEFIADQYRLPQSVDGGRHASAEGHQRIAGHLFNAMVDRGWIRRAEYQPPALDVAFPRPGYDAADIEAEFGFWWPFAARPDLVTLEEGFVADAALFSVLTPRAERRISIDFELIDDVGLYPLELVFDIVGDDVAEERHHFDRFEPGKHYVELVKPGSLDGYPVVEVRVRSSRVVYRQGMTRPVSIPRPAIRAN